MSGMYTHWWCSLNVPIISGLYCASWLPYELPMEILYDELYETLEPHIAHYIEANPSGTHEVQ